MTTQQALRIIRKKNPGHPRDLSRTGIYLKKIGEGFSRKVYSVVGTSLVVKFVYQEFHQALREMQALPKLSKSPFKRYTPKVYYTNKDTGTVVMRYYKPCRDDGSYENVGDKIATFLGYHEGHDYMGNNFGKTPSGQLKLLDLGLS